MTHRGRQRNLMMHAQCPLPVFILSALNKDGEMHMEDISFLTFILSRNIWVKVKVFSL